MLTFKSSLQIILRHFQKTNTLSNFLNCSEIIAFNSFFYEIAKIEFIGFSSKGVD